MSDRLIGLLKQPRRPQILLVGDVMLDRYLWGDVERISPEAPIPVLRVHGEEHRLGGAGSVAAMLVALEAEPLLATVLGDDQEGCILLELLEQNGIDCRCVLRASERPTTVKERLLGRSHQHYPHHMMRVDREIDEPIRSDLAEQLLSHVAQRVAEVDLVVVSDYDKGVCAGELIPRLVALARSAGVPVLADPVRNADYHRYAGCACITPNRLEAGLASGMKIATPQDGLKAARLMLRFGVEAALVTLDRDGIAWADKAGGARLFPARAREVCDITGAGDMVLSAVGYSLAAGADSATAVELANLAGGLEVERLGVVPLSRRELLAELSHGTCSVDHKILPLDQLRPELDRQRQAGRRIVMTNGCFDLLHPGHIALLKEASTHGDRLLVGLNSDRSVQALKGEGRPIIDQHGRAEMLAALAWVDYVVVFDDTSVASLVEHVLPDVLVKGADYSLEEVAGRMAVESHGGHVVLVPMKPGYSTTGVIGKFVGANGRSSPESKRTSSAASGI